MKELGRLLIYLTMAGVVIFALAGLGSIDAVSGALVGIIAIILVVILPVYVVIRMAKKEHKDRAKTES
ncbi:hypothetical protein MNBD_GAMMA16-1771 [hydrothermal vent metagenome]|uniref:Uncharacterized protein n=1 Tax=hydrothermal vent metagenome TaxID=652676 RepID=A0A3B0Z4J5_9ZZZZ